MLFCCCFFPQHIYNPIQTWMFPCSFGQTNFHSKCFHLKYSQGKQMTRGPWLGQIQMDSGFENNAYLISWGVMRCNGNGCPPHPQMTKIPLRISAAITIHLFIEMTCKWVIYHSPAVFNCAGKHCLSPPVTKKQTWHTHNIVIIVGNMQDNSPSGHDYSVY